MRLRPDLLRLADDPEEIGGNALKNVKGSQTEHNLLASFAGESQARNRYTYFSSVAKKEGLEQISAIFADTADNEKEHAKRFFSLLQGGEVTITAGYPAGLIGTTAENLKAAAAGENLEHTRLYPGFADAAEKEGFSEAALLWRNIGKVEVGHEKRYLALLANLEKGCTFKRDTKVRWRCRNCGFIHEGTEAPGKCPACAHPQAYFEVFNDIY
jgi:rubrerythrin